MRLGRLRLYMAGLIALLVGLPLTEEAFGQPDQIVNASLDLASAIMNASAGYS